MFTWRPLMLSLLCAHVSAPVGSVLFFINLQVLRCVLDVLILFLAGWWLHVVQYKVADVVLLVPNLARW